MQGKMFSIARQLLANGEDADDAVQETFLRLWQKREQLATHPSVEGYAMQTLKNICLDKIKLKKDNVSIDYLEFSFSNDETYNAVQNRDSTKIIKRIIETLPKLQKMIITMRDVEEYELSEIAEITGTTVAAVKVNLSRARKRVRDVFISIESHNLTGSRV